MKISNRAISIIKAAGRQVRSSLTRLGYYSRPAFILIGAQKCGTSALFAMLGQHPQIIPPACKEMDFFDGLGLNYGDFPAYHSLFPLPHQLGTNKITFEATPNYLCRPECPRRIYDYAPDLRLIVSLREPAARAYSAWNMYHRFATSLNPAFLKLAEHRTFEAAINDELDRLERGDRSGSDCTYIKRGLYVEQLQRYFQYFARESILIIDYHDLGFDPAACLAQVCRFLRIDDTYHFSLKQVNVSTYESDLPSATADRLRAFYGPYNRQLFDVLGREFKW